VSGSLGTPLTLAPGRRAGPLFFCLTVSLGLLPACSGCFFASPQEQIGGVLKRWHTEGARFQASAGAELVFSRLALDRILLKPEDGGVTVVATVDAEGTFQGIAVSLVGLERIPFSQRDGRWVPPDAGPPALDQVITVLQARRAALARADVEALETLAASGWTEPDLPRDAAVDRARRLLSSGPVRRHPVRWVVRVERESAEVLEEYRPPDGDGTLRVRSTLVREDGRLRFASGLL